MKPLSDSINRRTFMAQCTGMVAAAACLPDRADAESASPVAHQAMGTRVGEVTDHSAIVWTRISAEPSRNHEGLLIRGRAADYQKKPLPQAEVPVAQLEGACPGKPGRVRLRYGTQADFSDAITTGWQDVTEATDFIHQFALGELKAATTYHYESETADIDGKPHGRFRGEFRTAPAAATPTDLTFCVMTCQGYPDRGHPDGHPIYPAMLALKPAFACLTGDLVYYDNDMPRATSPELARYHWQRMFSLPRLVDFNRHVATCWLKDDHDTLNNDSWPGQRMGTFTFAEGQRIFRQQAPMADGPAYRTFRWGRDLQIWLTDGRDFRSPNNMPDGPEKSIWGAEQKEWFKRTVKESDATWKVLVSPTPLVGPDRGNKNDNHANEGFRHEGDEIRAWLKANVPDHFFVICGDRHWQYHSVHPATGVHEFCPGPASDQHAGGTPGFVPEFHRFHRPKGGFLSITLSHEVGRSRIRFQHHDADGKVVYEWSSDATL
jgi:alkaline phosphatase D